MSLSSGNTCKVFTVKFCKLIKGLLVRGDRDKVTGELANWQHPPE